MIRINLLPVKAAQRRASGLRHILIAGVAILVAMTGLVAFHTLQSNQLNIIKARSAAVDEQIKKLKAEVGDYDQVLADRDALMRQKNAIRKLEEARTGPAFLMRELSDILTKGRGPSITKDSYDEALKKDPNASFNANWEPKRCWLISYVEKDKVVAIKGGAKSGEDVAEFLRRLKLSPFFDPRSVYWQQTQPQSDTRLNNVAYVTFDVTARVNY